MKKIIAISNHKGGVGKTTSVASIGAILSSKGYKVLMIDLDAQSNLTSSLTQEEPERTIYNALRERSELPILEIKENLHLTPSSLELAGIELELSSAMSREFILKDLIEPIADNYDYILLDTPPSLGLIVVNSFVAATDLYIPLTAEALPFKGLKMITDIASMVQKRLNPELSLSGIFITRWGGRKLNKMVEEALRANFGEKVFNTKVRENISIAEAPLTGKGIIDYAPNSNGAQDYLALTEELLSK